MLQLIVLLVGLAALFIALSAQLTARSGGERRDVGIIPNDWDIVAATHAAQAPFSFGPPAPTVEIINLSAPNRIHIAADEHDADVLMPTQCST